MPVFEERNPLEALAEEFLERYRSGARPGLTEYVRKHPELADKIRELFPTLVMMEEIGPGKVEPLGPYQGSASADGRPLTQLGEYRILREIGRGGMGLVFEAVQEPLGRHVALKVLPYRLAADPVCLARFHCEARAAAHLHHTNIVPVFDVGEHDGVHYFAMQYIHGHSLDEVLREVRRLKHVDNAGSEHLAGPTSKQVALGEFSDRSAGALSEALFRAAPCDATSSELESGDGVAADSASESTKASAVTNHDLVRTDLSNSSSYNYCRSVARIGMQVAEGLAYAHGQKVLHRDIKPANLLLDLEGTVWITDFGLAKDQDDGLTKTGDIVGTLRYMAPERFDGVADQRSDVCSLGLTLYELLTLRPAFAESDRTRLIRKVANEEPPRPRAVEPRIPRDLETIVLKAIARDPGQRYASATDLAEDLRRFISDRPIFARRATTFERAWRWARRNPGWAATWVTVFALLAIIALGGGLMSLHLGRALTDVKTAEAEKTEKLWQSYLERARAVRTSGRVGQRFEALKTIREAAKIRVGPELRNEAIAALILPDIEIHREWEASAADALGVVFDKRFDRYVRFSRLGEITVCRATASGEKIEHRLPAHGRAPFRGMWLSDDGRYFAYGHSSTRDFETNGVRVWKLDGPQPEPWLDLPGMTHWAVCFHPDGRRLAIGHTDRTLSVYHLDERRSVVKRPIEQPAQSLEFHPRDGRLAAAFGGVIRLFNLDSGHELAPLRLDKASNVSGMSWHPDGRHLAAGYHDLKIRVWDTETASEAMTPWQGAGAEGIRVRYNHAGDRLLSDEWGAQTRLWDAVNGRLLLTMRGYLGLQFSEDDRLIGPTSIEGKLRLSHLADGRELRTLRRPHAKDNEEIGMAVLDKDERVAVVGWMDTLSFFDLENGKELATTKISKGRTSPRSFDSRGGLLTSGSLHAYLWPSRFDPERPDLLRVGPPREVSPARWEGAGASRDGRWMAIPCGTHALLVDRENLDAPRKLGPQYDVRYCTVSPDGKWAVTCSWWWDGKSNCCRIWEAQTGRHICDLPLPGFQAMASFSPDGAWLVTSSTPHGTRIWETGSWRERFQFGQNAFVFGADGHWWLNDANGAIRMLEAGTDREILRLTGPEATNYFPHSTTSSGDRLIAAAGNYRSLLVWDLRHIRSQLQELGLDWAAKPFPPPLAARPVQVEIDAGALKLPAKSGTSTAAADGDADAWLRRGLAALERGQQMTRVRERENTLRQAAEDFTHVIALKPALPLAYKHRGTIRVELNEYALALIDLQKVADLGWESAAFYNRLAWYYVTFPEAVRDPKKALPLIQLALKKRPGYSTFLNTLGVVHYRLGDYPEAIRAFEESCRANYGVLTAFDAYFLAMAHHRLGEGKLAKEHFDRAVAWHDQPPRKLSPAHLAELERHRREAEALLSSR